MTIQMTKSIVLCELSLKMINYWCYDYHTKPEWEYKLWLLKGETCLHQEGEKNGWD